MTQSRRMGARSAHRVLVISLCALPALAASYAVAQRTARGQGKSTDETATILRQFRAQHPDWDQPLRVHAAATAIYAELP